jgi:hypothetical protein
VILPSDADYKATKKIKQGVAIPREPFRTVIEDVSNEFEMKVLNAVYDKVPRSKRPRLMIVLDHERDALTLHGERGWDHEKQARVKEIFENAQKGRIFGRYDTRDLFVVFSSFERVARIDAVGHIQKKQLEAWKAELGDPNIWLIQTGFSSVTVFYDTEMQAHVARSAGQVADFATGLSKITKLYDEFGYLAERPAEVYIDSKENFEITYGGNWYYYYK